jgi:hypothetical protein
MGITDFKLDSARGGASNGNRVSPGARGAWGALSRPPISMNVTWGTAQPSPFECFP